MCHFCDQKNVQDFLIEETPYCSVLFNRFPVGKMSFLVIPKGHYTRIDEMPDDVRDDFAVTTFRFITECERLLGSMGEKKGLNQWMNEGNVAGQSAEHLHAHIALRALGDGLQGFQRETGDRGGKEIEPKDMQQYRDVLS